LKSGGMLRARSRCRPPTTSQILGTPRLHEPRTPLARSGQGAASARTVGSGLRVVYGGVRHARSDGCEGAAGGSSAPGGHLGFGGRGLVADGSEAGRIACPTSFSVFGGPAGSGRGGVCCGALAISFTFCRSNVFAPCDDLCSFKPVFVVAPMAFPCGGGCP
jgi:hypothetical protein